MFENVGRKIKILAEILTYCCIICGFIIALIGLVNYFQGADHIEYATIYGGSRYDTLTEAGNKAYYGLQMFKYGLISAIAGFLSSWPLYGFGELVENTENISYIISRMKNEEK